MNTKAALSILGFMGWLMFSGCGASGVQQAPTTVPTSSAFLPVESDAALQTYLSDAQIEKIFRGLGFEYEMVKEGVYRFYLSGYKVMLFNGGDNILLFAGFGAQPPLAEINAWNQNKKYSRAYLDAQGDAIVEADMTLEGGVTRANVQAFIMTFRMTVNAFAERVFAVSHGASATPVWQQL